MKIWLLFISISASLLGFTQNEKDALRYSSLHFGGSARSNAMGGAFGALGGDLYSASTNPAGIGVYRSSQFSFSPAFISNYTSSKYYGTVVNNFKLNLNTNSIGYVATIDVSKGVTGWQRLNFAIGYNKLANFSNRYAVQGVNTTSSAIDQWVASLNQNGGVDAATINNNAQFYQGPNLAYQTYLIDYDTTVTTSPYRSALKKYGQTQSFGMLETGSIGESFLSVGANYSNKLYVGLSLSSSKIAYNYKATYTEETAISDTLSALESFTLGEVIATKGTGYNAKIGLIYRPIDYVRLGAAIQVPTIYSMSDTWATDMESVFKDSITYYYTDPKGSYDYILITPYRATLSAAVQVGKLGLISADYEIVGYNSSRFSSAKGGYNFNAENAAISSQYATAGNLKIGTEWRVDQFRIRAGYGYFGNAIKNNLQASTAYSTYSLGVGYKVKGYFIDAAYNLSKKSGEFYLYNSSVLSPTTTTNNIHRITITIGFKF